MATSPDRDQEQGEPQELRGIIADLDIELARVDRLMELTEKRTHSDARPIALSLRAGLLRVRERLYEHGGLLP